MVCPVISSVRVSNYNGWGARITFGIVPLAPAGPASRCSAVQNGSSVLASSALSPESL